jgi:hypothetical protein
LSATKASLPRVEVCIGQRTFQAILDSEASANFVSGRIFQAEDVTRQQLELASREAVSHTIRLVRDEAFHIRPYHSSQDKKRALFECVSDMLALGAIERSDSECCSPVVLVRKKDGTVRFSSD